MTFSPRWLLTLIEPSTDVRTFFALELLQVLSLYNHQFPLSKDFVYNSEQLVQELLSSCHGKQL